ncbi:MAG: transposase [Nitrosomonas sp.]|nr:transposase [Nitrosomonas sp.]
MLHWQGKSIRSIAKALNVSRNTVRNTCADIARTPTYSRRDDRPSKLEPFKTYLLERIEARLTRVDTGNCVLSGASGQKDMDGKEGILRNYIRQFGDPTEPVRRFETPQGSKCKWTLPLFAVAGRKLKLLSPRLVFTEQPMCAGSEYERQED